MLPDCTSCGVLVRFVAMNTACLKYVFLLVIFCTIYCMVQHGACCSFPIPQVKPEAKSYYELGAATLKFIFPDPLPLDGVTSRQKSILNMKVGIHREERLGSCT